MRRISPDTATWLIAMPIAGVLLYSSMLHTDNEYKFLSAVYSYQLVGKRVGVAVAAILPFLQMIAGLMLLFAPRHRASAFCWCIILFVVFVTVQSATLARGLNITCGCFGSTEPNPIGATSISLAVTGLILSSFGYCLAKRQQPVAPQPAMPAFTHCNK